MPSIKVLDPTLANMIAAGEVVERPSSVVKELVENSLDAQSSIIDIYISNGGRSFIVVIDDGKGMDNEDAINAFKRHATSKIDNKLSLFRINTLGFRGEAIPSIASVAEVIMETSSGDGVGTKVISSPSSDLKVSYTSARKGTSISVNNLFFNTPARLKHLKNDYIETASIQEVVSKLALAHQDVAFRLYINNKLNFITNGKGNLLEIIAANYGIETAKDMIYFKNANYDFEIEGYVSKISLTKSNRYYITTILNNRAVRMNQVTNAVLASYKTLIPVDRFPLVVIKIKTDPSLVDVNVHPSKHEVRLSKDEELYDLIQSTITTTLEETNMKVSLDKSKETEARVIQMRLNINEISEDTSIPEYYKKSEDTKIINEPLFDFPLSEKTNKDDEIENDNNVEENIESKGDGSFIIEKESTIKGEFLLKLTIIGQVHGTYIVASSEDGVYFIDQHAAMERINYEYFSKVMLNNNYVTPLLIPLIIELSMQEINLLIDKLHTLLEVGIKAEIFGTNALRIVEIPHWMSNVNVAIYVNDMIDFILKRNNSRVSLKEEAIMSLACKASLKANKALTNEEMTMILRRLAKCVNPLTCPHGRPISIFYSKYALDKAFKRVG